MRLNTRFADTALLLRPEAPKAVGDTLNLDVFVAGDVDTVYLDIAKGKQTFGLVTLPVADGVAQAALNIDGSLLGTLDLNVYGVNERGNIVRDRRFVLVNPAPAAITIAADKDVYRPGDDAVLDINVSRDGAPMPSALGVAIVDESVFALGAQDPGFVRTFFLLDRELDEPWYEIHDFAPITDDDPSPYDGKVRPLRANTDPVALQRSRDIALFGFFGEELAATSPSTKTAGTASEDRLALLLGWTARAGIALPLLGIGFYDGSKRRRRLLIGLVLLGMVSFLWGACASPASAPVPAAGEAPAGDDFAFEESAAAPASADQPEPPRLRQFFPETLFWLPEAVTDADGHAQLTVPVADTITTWRVSVVASDKDGNLGSAQAGLRVFQDFFVEPDLPRFLTVGDEVSVPVSLFNYLDEAQTIEIAVDAADWFEFTADATITVDLAAAEVSVAYIPIRVTGFGDHTFTVTATGSVLSDAVQREVQVLPDGQARQDVVNGTLERATQASVLVPADAVGGTSTVTVKIYPGVVSQLVDGLSGMLREPYGCFEQTTSVNYPNVMILDYLRNTEQLSPRIERQAERFVDLGYQRLLTFETDYPGGFSFYGDPPPLDMLTAYGLMQFTDMSRVQYVDPDLLQRMSVYLLDRQIDDHWQVDSYGYNYADDFTNTAYITWALAEAGYGNTMPMRRAARYLVRNADKFNFATSADATPTPISISPLATPADMQPAPIYPLALTANALLAMDNRDRDALDLLDLLVPLAVEDESGLHWQSNSMLGTGYTGDIETTALMVLALQRSGQYPDLAQRALDYLIAQRQPYGAFGTTQATVLVLKALINDAIANRSDAPTTVTVTFNGGRTQTFTLDDTNVDVVQQVVFDDIAPGEQIVDPRGR
ncbi:MAG: alpha-2-macroglobulin family protein [Caldilineaceae bacterium]